MLLSKCYLSPPARSHVRRSNSLLEVSGSLACCVVVVLPECVCIYLLLKCECASRRVEGLRVLFLINKIKSLTSEPVTTVQMTKCSSYKTGALRSLTYSIHIPYTCPVVECVHTSNTLDWSIASHSIKFCTGCSLLLQLQSVCVCFLFSFQLLEIDHFNTRHFQHQSQCDRIPLRKCGF